MTSSPSGSCTMLPNTHLIPTQEANSRVTLKQVTHDERNPTTLFLTLCCEVSEDRGGDKGEQHPASGRWGRIPAGICQARQLITTSPAKVSASHWSSPHTADRPRRITEIMQKRMPLSNSYWRRRDGGDRRRVEEGGRGRGHGGARARLLIGGLREA